MEYSPPPLFKQGAPARVKVTVFALISIALLAIDSHVQSLSTIRQVAGTILYPFQMVALMPRDAAHSVADYFSSLTALEAQLRELKRQQVLSAQAVQQSQLYQAENAQLRRLMQAREHLPVRSMMSEILYDTRDAATRKVVLDRGSRHGVALGLPVIDNLGVVGQVTRIFPFTSEVTLLTDKDQAIPVQVLRNGLRTVAYGRGKSGLLDLRFVVPNADIQVGDVLITSGMDGVYPAGLAVAKVTQVESTASGDFGRVVCQPLAGIDRNRQLLVLLDQPELPPAPPEAVAKSGKRGALPKMEPIPAPPAQGVAPAAPEAPKGAIAGAAQAAPKAPAQGTPVEPRRTPPAATQPPRATGPVAPPKPKESVR